MRAHLGLHVVWGELAVLPARNLELPIVHAEASFVVVDKPAGMLSIPGRGPEKADCVIARLRRAYPQAEGSLIVHRLDMATSGLLVVALSIRAQRELCIQFEQRTIHKRYVALVEGHPAKPPEKWGRVELAFRLDPNNRPHQVYDPRHGKLGVTEWRVLGREGTRTRVELHPLTGRTHQLRLHAAHALGLNAPIVGDPLYGSSHGEDRMHLHATELGFVHPETKAPLRWESAAPFPGPEAVPGA